MENQEAYEKAKKRVEEKMGFYIHIIVYIVVGTFLVIINLVTSPKNLWFKWPLMGWAVGVIFHFLFTFVFHERSTITEQMIEKEMKKEASNKQ